MEIYCTYNNWAIREDIKDRKAVFKFMFHLLKMSFIDTVSQLFILFSHNQSLLWQKKGISPKLKVKQRICCSAQWHIDSSGYKFDVERNSFWLLDHRTASVASGHPPASYPADLPLHLLLCRSMHITNSKIQSWIKCWDDLSLCLSISGELMKQDR